MTHLNGTIEKAIILARTVEQSFRVNSMLLIAGY